MQDEVNLSIKYMESVNYSSNLPPKNPLKIILKRKKLANTKKTWEGGQQQRRNFQLISGKQYIRI